MGNTLWAALRCRVWVSLLLLFALAGCGGGGGGAAADPPAALLTITAQPADQASKEGGSVTFVVQAVHVQRYQWQRRQSDAAAWLDIAGANLSSLTLPAVQLTDQGGQYRVLIEGAGQQLVSSAVTLQVQAVITAPQILLSPESLSVVAGSATSFAVTATGSSLQFRWERSTDGQQWVVVEGVQLQTLSFGAVAQTQHAGYYRVHVSNAAGSVVSASARLQITPAPVQPVFTTSPQAAQLEVGATAVFAASASGVPEPALRWQLSRDRGGSWTDAVDADSRLSLGPVALVDDGLLVRCIARNASGSTISDSARLTVSPKSVVPTLSSQPNDVTIALGDEASFSAEVQGTPTPVLQWQLSRDRGSNWLNINGAQAGTLRLSQLSTRENGNWFRLVASNVQGSVSSRAAVLTVNARVQFKLVAGAEGGRGYQNGPLATALFNDPSELTADAAGNLYVQDSFTIRKIDLGQGLVSTLAGQPFAYAERDGQAPSLLNSGGIRHLQPLADGTLYFVNDGRLRRLNPDGSLTTIKLGTPPPAFGSGTDSGTQFARIDAMVVDAARRVWFASGEAVFFYEPSTGQVRPVAGRYLEVPGSPLPPGAGLVDGRGENIRFRSIRRLLVEGANIVVHDYDEPRDVYVRRILPSLEVKTRFAETVPWGSRPLIYRNPGQTYETDLFGVIARPVEGSGQDPAATVRIAGRAPLGGMSIQLVSSGAGEVLGLGPQGGSATLRWMSIGAGGRPGPTPMPLDAGDRVLWAGGRWLVCKEAPAGTAYTYRYTLHSHRPGSAPRELLSGSYTSDMGSLSCGMITQFDDDHVSINSTTITPSDAIESPPLTHRYTSRRLASDAAGNVYFSTESRSTAIYPSIDIRRRRPDGVEELLLGPQAQRDWFAPDATPLASVSRNAVLDQDGRLYVGDPMRRQLWRIDPQSQRTERFDIGLGLEQIEAQWTLAVLGNDRLLISTGTALVEVSLPGLSCDCPLKPLMLRRSGAR